MRLVSVAGACSRAGKTAAAVTLLRCAGRGNASAVKFTTTEDVWERCPRGTPCVVCDIDVPFRVIEDPKLLGERGTDTDRLLEAGARRVIWAIARQSAVAEAWRSVLSRLGGDGCVVMEGSTIAGEAVPDRLLFVVHPFLAPSRWKPTTPALVERADLVVVNRPAEEAREPAPQVLEALAEARGERPVLVADVTRPLREWAPDLARELAASRDDTPTFAEAHADIPRP